MILNNNKIAIPDGEYEAKWSGFTMGIENGKEIVKIKTLIGCKSQNYPIRIEIKDGNIINWKT